MLKRRGNNEGTIYKRKDGWWIGQISLPDGKRKSFYGKTRASVQERMTAAKSDLAKGLPLPDERQSLGTYLTSWLEGVASEIRPASLRRYRDAVNLHLIPALGKTALTKLTAQQVKVFYSQKVRSGLSPTTVYHMHGVLHRTLEDALEMGLVARDVTEMVKAPQRAHKEMLTLTTGMREGELLVLHWQDVDLERGKLVVRFNVEETDAGFRMLILNVVEQTHYCHILPKQRPAIAAVRHHAQEIAARFERRQCGKRIRKEDGMLEMVSMPLLFDGLIEQLAQRSIIHCSKSLVPHRAFQKATCPLVSRPFSYGRHVLAADLERAPEIKQNATNRAVTNHEMRASFSS